MRWERLENPSKKEWKEFLDSKPKLDYFDDVLEEEIHEESKLDLIDKLQEVISLDKLEALLEEPLESIKEKIADVIKDKLNLEPEKFFDYFRNYEDDMIRILVFQNLSDLFRDIFDITQIYRTVLLGRGPNGYECDIGKHHCPFQINDRF